MSIERTDDNLIKVVSDNKATEHVTKTLILALGAGACVPKKLDVEHNSAFEGESMFYAVKNKEKFRAKNVLIIGGGDSAVDWANEFSHIAGHVTLIHRRDQFRAVQTSV